MNRLCDFLDLRRARVKLPRLSGELIRMLRGASVASFVSALGLGLTIAGSLGCGGGGSGSSCPAFAHIVGGAFGQAGDRLWWTLEVAAMPATLTFDQADVPANVLEYQWAVDLDPDRNGAPDLRVAISHFRQSGASETSAADILSVTSEDLWTIFGAGSSTSGSIDVTLTGNTFRLEAAIAEDPGLAQITERSQSTWTTFHKFGRGLGDQCEDRRN